MRTFVRFGLPCVVVAYVAYPMLPIAFAQRPVATFARAFALAALPFFGYLAWRGGIFVALLSDESRGRRRRATATSTTRPERRRP